MDTSLAVDSVPAIVPARAGAVAAGVPASAPVEPPREMPPDPAALQRAVTELNRHFSSVRTDLKFSIDKDLGRIVVAVIDTRDGSILRQIPGEEALRIARMLKSGRHSLIEAQA